MTELVSHVDAYLGGDWRRLGAATGGTVRHSPPPKVVVGTKDEAPKASPSKLTFTLNDPDGDYDPGNVMGQWWPELSENTRVRASVPILSDDFEGGPILDGWGTAGDGSPWVNNVAASSGGTVADTDWSRSDGVVRHSVPTDNALRVSDLPARGFINSELRFRWFKLEADVSGASVAVAAKLRTVDDNNFIYVRVLITSTDLVYLAVVDRIDGVDRILLGDTFTGLDAIGVLTFDVAVQAEGQVIRASVWKTSEPEPLDWQVTATRATVREGYMGLFSQVMAGNTDTKPLVFGYYQLDVSVPVFYGEIAEFAPGVYDESDAAPYVAITAAGIGRRVEQGSDPLKSAMFRAWSSRRGWIREGAVKSTSAVGSHNTLQGAVGDSDDVPVGAYIYLVSALNTYKEDHLFQVTANAGGQITFTPDALQPIQLGDTAHSFRLATDADLPVAYWPCEDERDLTRVASGLPGGTPMEVRVDSPEGAAFDSFRGSAPILKLNNAELVGLIPDYTDTHEAVTIHFLAHFPAADEAATGQAILQFYTTGTAEVWALQYAAGGGDGDLVISAWSAATGALLFSTPYDLGMRGTPRMVTLTLRHTAPTTVTYSLATVEFFPNGATAVAGPANATATGVTDLGKVTSVQVNPGGGYVDVGFGHLAVVPAPLVYFNLQDEPHGHMAENLPRRMARLAFEEGEPLTYCQSTRSSETLGPQQRDTLLANLRAGVDMNLGRFYESRGAYSFEYRTRTTLYNQTPVLDLNYGDGAVLADLRPVRDDQASRNDITAKREGGSSARAVKETGPKSVEAVGRYTAAPTVNAHTDGQLQPYADWLVHLGTVAEDRYPTIRITSANGAVSLERLLSIGIGDRIRITGAGARRRWEPIDQLVPGYTLILHRFKPVLEMNCVPASPYRTAELDLAGVDLGSDDSELTEDITPAETDVDVATTGALWTTDPTHTPFDVLIGGERCTVTAVTGATSPQTLTVTRAVNGVNRDWPTGTPVTLADPYYIPL